MNVVKNHEELVDNLRKQAEFILALEDNWDSEGSESYDPKTVSRAVNICLEVGRMGVAMPKIMNGANGGIDIRWEGELGADNSRWEGIPEFVVLMHVPKNEREPCAFYSRDFEGNEVYGDYKGELKAWMKKVLTTNGGTR